MAVSEVQAPQPLSSMACWMRAAESSPVPFSANRYMRIRHTADLGGDRTKAVDGQVSDAVIDDHNKQFHWNMSLL